MFATPYYCLVASLKEYALDADTKGFDARAIVSGILEEVNRGDAREVRLLYGYYDCENIAALRAGRPLPVLFESREGGMCFGHTPEFLEVRVAAGADLRGSEATVLPRSRDGGVLTAELI